MIKYETNSKLVCMGQIFIALKGQNFDGHDYIDEAIKNGAIKVVVSREVNATVEIEVVPDTNDYLNKMLKKEYSFLFDELFIIGVTGTNGKTTTAHIVYQMLRKLNETVVYLGTLGYIDNHEIIHFSNTTPDILTTYKMLLKAVEDNIKYVVLEASSHGLDLNRLYGVKFNIGAFTNLTPDHLDYHKNMSNYLSAKLKILDNLREGGMMVVNGDDVNHKLFISSSSCTVGLNGDYEILNYTILDGNTNMIFGYGDLVYNVVTNFSTVFDVYNYLMALCIVCHVGFLIEDIIKITNKVISPSGRNEFYKLKKGYAVIDYAHTEDSIEKIINTYNKIKKGRLFVVIGCAGERDRIKRPIIGELVTRLSEYTIFTSDNPRYESEDQIIADITGGLILDNYKVILDRKLAIKECISMLGEDDILLILGKGHEKYQAVKDEKIAYSDQLEVLKY